VSLRAATSAAILIGRVEAGVGAAVVAGLAAGIASLTPYPWPTVCYAVVAVAFLSAIVEATVVVPLAVRNFRVEILDTGVVVYRGALLRSVDHIPTAKITVVRRQSGPLLRRLGVAKCVLFTPAREVVLLPMSSSCLEQLSRLGLRRD
jgi:membrane protein YdbS with pleckstrin-like domain